MTKPFEDYSLAEAVEDWWDTNIEKIKQKLGHERFVNELDAAVRGRSEYLQTSVTKALLTKKYKWEDTEMARSDNQDEIEETLANLASQDKDWRDEKWDSFEESHNGDRTFRNKLEARVTRLERLLIERSMGYGNEPSNAMKIWSFLRDNGPSTSADVKNIFQPSQRASIASMLTNMLKADCIRRHGDKLVANLDYKWDDVGVIPRTAQQELMNSVKNNVEAPIAKQSRVASNNTKRVAKTNNLPDIKECIKQLEWKLDHDFDADDIHVWNEDNKLYANVLICGKAYGDSYTERYRVLYSVNVKDYGEGHYTSIFDASKIIMQGDGIYDTNDLPYDQKSISVYTDFRCVESLTITYIMDYD